MASKSSPIATSPMALVVYNPQRPPVEDAKVYMHKIQDLFIERSFKAQLSDVHSLQPSIQERILTGTFLIPENGNSLPRPFNGTRKELLSKITSSVHSTVDSLDYNGLWPYLKIMDQLEEGKTFKEIKIDSRNEGQGSTCVGMSHAILKNLKEKHGIEGALAVQRKSYLHPFEHGAVIIECSDGFVLLDSRSNSANRIFSIRFGSTKQYKYFSITASKPGSVIPLSIKVKSDDHPEITYEYCTDVANGDDLVMKHYVMKAALSFIPISMYNRDGSARKYIIVVPNESKIVLKNNNAIKKEETITFRSILRGELLPKLEAFMKADFPYLVPGFHISIENLHQQITKFAAQEESLKKLFKQTNVDEGF